MRTAPPPVALRLPAGRRERVLVAALHALAAGALTGWLVQRGLVGGHPVLWSAALLLSTWVGWGVLRPVCGELRWDGSGWVRLEAPGASPMPCAVQLQWDLGNWMLLRLSEARSRRAGWCGVSKAQAGPSWHGLRLVLYHCAADGTAAGGSA